MARPATVVGERGRPSRGRAALPHRQGDILTAGHPGLAGRQVLPHRAGQHTGLGRCCARRGSMDLFLPDCDQTLNWINDLDIFSQPLINKYKIGEFEYQNIDIDSIFRLNHYQIEHSYSQKSEQQISEEQTLIGLESICSLCENQTELIGQQSPPSCALATSDFLPVSSADEVI